jgi:hypothetical protein
MMTMTCLMLDCAEASDVSPGTAAPDPSGELDGPVVAAVDAADDAERLWEGLAVALALVDGPAVAEAVWAWPVTPDERRAVVTSAVTPSATTTTAAMTIGMRAGIRGRRCFPRPFEGFDMVAEVYLAASNPVPKAEVEPRAGVLA